MGNKVPETIFHDIIGLRFPRVNNLSATGEAVTVRVSGILKASPTRDDLELLERFQSLMGTEFATVFPQFHDYGMRESLNVWELEDLGDMTIEKVILEMSLQSSAFPKVRGMIEGVAEHIRRLAIIRPQTERYDTIRRAFIEELLSSIERNAHKAQIEPLGLTPEQCLEHAQFVPTLCHRDLSTGNVMCTPSGVRLIDPRWLVPEATVSRPSEPFGSIAIDCQAFAISLWRKILERGQGTGWCIRWDEDFDRHVTQQFVRDGLFNQFMWYLCRTHAFSVYAGCRCDYCLASERAWLYQRMREECEQGFENLRRMAE